MKEKTTDRRVRYTKMVIRESFVNLLKQYPISRITIKKLCEDADINRATFYAHYADQFELLDQIETELIEGIDYHIRSLKNDELEYIPSEMLENVLRYIRENAELFQLLLSGHGDLRFLERVVAVIGGKHQMFLPPGHPLSPEDSSYVFAYFANGAIGIILKWLEDGMVKSEKETAELLLHLSLYGRKGLDVKI